MANNFCNLKKHIEDAFLSEIENKRFLVMFLNHLVSKLRDEDPSGRILASGGVVRDLSASIAFGIDISLKDLDFVVEGISDSQLQYMLEKLSKRCEGVEWFDRVGMSFPVWKVKVRDIPEALDIALTRTERSFGSGHRDFYISSVGVSVEEESLRRDFTINALYLELIQDERRQLKTRLHDFHGGLHSLLNREIRCVGKAEDRFNEDPLRMLRAMRFEAKLGFSIEENTSKAIHTLIPNLLGTVARERIADEIYRTLILNPELAIDNFYRYGVFQEILPVIARMPKDASHRLKQQMNILVKKYGHCLNPALIFATLFQELVFTEFQAMMRNNLWTAKMDEHFFHVPRLSQLAKRNKLPNVRTIEYFCRGALILVHFDMLNRKEAVVEGLIGNHSYRDEIISLYSVIQESYGNPIIDFISIVEKLPRHSLDFGQLIRDSGLPIGPHLRNIKVALRQAEINGEINDNEGARSFLDWLYASDTHLIKDHVDKICSILRDNSSLPKDEKLHIAGNIASEIRWLLFTRPERLLQAYRNRNVLEYIFPELAEAECIEHESMHHFSRSTLNDVMIGLSLLYEEKENPTPLQILSMIFLDIGKPKTMAINPDGTTTFYGHDLVGAEMAMNICKRLGIEEPITSDLYFIIRNHNTLISNGGVNRVRRLLHKVEPNLIRDLLLVHKLDQMAKMKIVAGQRIDEGQLDNYNTIMAQIDTWITESEENVKWCLIDQRPFLTGTDLKEDNPSWGIGLPEGPEIGRLKKALIDLQSKGIVKDKDEAIASVSGHIVLYHLLRNPVRYLNHLRKEHLIDKILPEFTPLIDFSQSSVHHAEDVFTHTLNVVKALPKNSSNELVLAALFHDTGKVLTRSWDEEKSVFHFYGHEKESADIFSKICQKFEWTNEDFDIDVALWLIFNHDRIKLPWSEMKRPKRTLRRILSAGGKPLDEGQERWIELVDLAEADIRGSVPDDSKTTDVKIAEITCLRVLLKEVIEKQKFEEQDRVLDERILNIWNGHSVLRHFPAKGPEIGRLVKLGQDYVRLKLQNEENVTEDQVVDHLINLRQG